VQLERGNKQRCKMTFIPVSVQLLFPLSRYPFVVRGWKGLHLVVHDGILEGVRQNRCNRCLWLDGGYLLDFSWLLSLSTL
jgi:hypothetical protein